MNLGQINREISTIAPRTISTQRTPTLYPPRIIAFGQGERCHPAKRIRDWLAFTGSFKTGSAEIIKKRERTNKEPNTRNLRCVLIKHPFAVVLLAS